MNRPAALNALNLDMIRHFSASLTSWEAREDIKAVFIKGAGHTAFCAGGDVKKIYKTGMAFRRGQADERAVSLFFGEEYCLNRRLFHFKKPLFAFMNGITMGGGFGIGGPCRYRIVSERTVFAMPETAIGFFPDVGSAWFLNKTPEQAGACLALTGGKTGPEDMLFCGFATHFVPLERQPALIKALTDALHASHEEPSDGKIKDILADFSQNPQKPGELQKNGAIIDRCFSGDEVESIIDRLHSEKSPWAAQQAAMLESRSPLSLKVTLAHLRMAKTMSFDEITAQDFILAQHFMRGHDFYEGVRAVLVDKDNRPQWEPKTPEGVSKSMVQDYFRQTGAALDEIAA